MERMRFMSSIYYYVSSYVISLGTGVGRYAYMGPGDEERAIYTARLACIKLSSIHLLCQGPAQAPSSMLPFTPHLQFGSRTTSTSSAWLNGMSLTNLLGSRSMYGIMRAEWSQRLQQMRPLERSNECYILISWLGTNDFTFQPIN